MANPTAANVVVASPLATGGVLTAADGTAIPTSIVAATTGFTGAGYVGEDGVTMRIDRQVEDVYAWGGDKVRTLETSHSVQLDIPFLEVNAQTLALVFGASNVSTSGTTTTINVKGGALPHFALIIESQDEDDKRMRLCAADAQIVSQDDITLSHSAPIEFNVTVELFPDANNNKAVIYYDTDSTDSSSSSS